MTRRRATHHRKNPRNSKPPRSRTVTRYPADSTMNAVLLPMIVHRAKETARGARGVVHVWGFGLIDDKTADRMKFTSFTSEEVTTQASVLDYTQHLRKTVRGIWGYGWSYLGPVDSLTTDTPMPAQAWTELAEGRMEDHPTTELVYSSVIYDARGRVFSSSMPLYPPQGNPTFEHGDTLGHADEFIEAFHAGVLNADLWFAALRLNPFRHEDIIRRALPEIALPEGRQ